MADKVFLKDIFGQNTVYISQDHESTLSHVGTGAVDYIPVSGVESPIYAPCKLKYVYGPNNTDSSNLLSDTNTLMFESVDTVAFADGTTATLAISFAHMSDSKYTSLGCSNWNSGKIFNKGDLLYYTGTKGYGSTGIHVHIRLAKGNFTSPWTKVNGYSVLGTNGTTPIKSDDVFYVDGITITYNSNTNYASEDHFNWKYSTNDSGGTETGTQLSGISLNATKQAFRVRTAAVSGSIITTISVGSSLPIVGFLGIQSDGYQWVKVKYNGSTYYSQLDTHNCYTITE